MTVLCLIQVHRTFATELPVRILASLYRTDYGQAPPRSDREA